MIFLNDPGEPLLDMQIHSVSLLMGREVNPLATGCELKQTMFLYLSKGQGRLVIDGVSHVAAADTFWVVPTGRLVCLELSTSSFGTLLLAGKLLSTRFRECLRMRVSNARARSELANLLCSIDTELRIKAPAYGLAAASNFAQLIVFIERNSRLHLHVEQVDAVNNDM